MWVGLRLLEIAGLRPRLGSDSLIGLDKLDPHPNFDVVRRADISLRPFSVKELL